MQNSLFETNPEPGVYERPAPTPIEKVNLSLVERFSPFFVAQPIFNRVWKWRDEAGEIWSAAATPWWVLATRGENAEAVCLDLIDSLIYGEEAIKREVHKCQRPDDASRSTFSRLQVWAGAAQWPCKCDECRGTGSGACHCVYDGYEHPSDQCQGCGGLGVARCHGCRERGTIFIQRRARLQKKSVNANLLACLLDLLAPAIADPATSNVWCWNDEAARVPCLRFEGEDWRLVMTSLEEPISMKKLEGRHDGT